MHCSLGFPLDDTWKRTNMSDVKDLWQQAAQQITIDAVMTTSMDDLLKRFEEIYGVDQNELQEAITKMTKLAVTWLIDNPDILDDVVHDVDDGKQEAATTAFLTGLIGHRAFWLGYHYRMAQEES